MSKVVKISWTEFAKALGIELSESPLEDYGGLDTAYEAGNNFIHEYQVENEVELSEDAKQEILDQFSMSVEAHWSPTKIMSYVFPTDTWVDRVNNWSKRGPQMAIYDRELQSGTAIPSWSEEGDDIVFTIDEPFLVAYAEGAYAVHGIADEGRTLDDVGAEDVARVMGWIKEAEGGGGFDLDLDRWDERWNGPNYGTLRGIADKGVIAQNKPEDEGVPTSANEFLNRVATIDFDRLSIPELEEWIGRTTQTYLRFKSTNPETIHQLDPILKNLQMAQMALDIRKQQEGLAEVAPVTAARGKPTKYDPNFVPTHLKPSTTHDGYYVVLTKDYDDNALSRSNWNTALAELGGESIDDDTEVGQYVITSGDEILVHRDAGSKLVIADEIGERLENYPVLNEDDYSDEQTKERDTDFEEWGKDEMINVIENSVPESVFEVVKADPVFEKILWYAFMESSSYYGESRAPRSLDEMKEHWEDMPTEYRQSQAFGIMNSVVEGGGSGIKDDDHAPELGDLVQQNPKLAGRIMQEYYKGKGIDSIQKLIEELKVAEDPRQMKMFESKNEDDIVKAADEYGISGPGRAELEDTDWESELREPAPTGMLDIDPQNVGVWAEGGNPDFVGDKVQQYAKKFGWDGAIRSSDEEEFYDTVQEAENFLNEKAPAGYYFGTNEDGDWGLWEGEGSFNPEPLVREVVEDAAVIAAPKDVADDLPEKIESSIRYGSTVRHLMKIRLAAIDPATIQWTKEGSDAVSKDASGKVISKIPWSDFEQDNPEIAGKVTTASILSDITIASEFHDDLWPRVNADIDVGSRVFIRSLNRFGEVVRTLDDGGAFRVQAGTGISTYFRQELEVRQASK
jgi:hypothetical protein